MTTLATMRTRIAGELIRTDINSEIDAAIKSAIALFEGQRYAFNEARLRLDTVASQELYTLPTDLRTVAGSALATGEDIIDIDSITLRWSSTGDPMEQVDNAWMEVYNSTSSTGQPCYWSRWDATLRIGPIPDAVYSLYMFGTKKLSTLSADGDSNAWMIQGERLIRAKAKALVARDVLKNSDEFGAAETAVREAEIELARKGSANQTRRIRAWGY